MVSNGSIGTNLLVSHSFYVTLFGHFCNLISRIKKQKQTDYDCADVAPYKSYSLQAYTDTKFAVSTEIAGKVMLVMTWNAMDDLSLMVIHPLVCPNPGLTKLSLVRKCPHTLQKHKLTDTKLCLCSSRFGEV